LKDYNDASNHNTTLGLGSGAKKSAAIRKKNITFLSMLIDSYNEATLPQERVTISNTFCGKIRKVIRLAKRNQKLKMNMTQSWVYALLHFTATVELKMPLKVIPARRLSYFVNN
jgi:hypothetical protein